jgi:hypothetical protein
MAEIDITYGALAREINFAIGSGSALLLRASVLYVYIDDSGAR